MKTTARNASRYPFGSYRVVTRYWSPNEEVRFVVVAVHHLGWHLGEFVA